MLKTITSLLSKKQKSSKSLRRKPRLFESLENRLVFAQFEVTNTNDAGPGSLRAVIAAINLASAPADEITLTFSASLASHVIELQTALPTLTRAKDLTIQAGSEVIEIR